MVVESDNIEDRPKIEAENDKKSERKIMRKYDFEGNKNLPKCDISEERAEAHEIAEPNKKRIGAMDQKLEANKLSQNSEIGSGTKMEGQDHMNMNNDNENMIQMEHNNNTCTNRNQN